MTKTITKRSEILLNNDLSEKRLKMVAGAGFEPTTFGL